MAIIKILPRDLVTKIAAGEVVERPASVVKELIENSIDSGAKNITVKIEGAGKTLIRVIDDGSGMEREDLLNAFTPHATSKINSIKDLFRIKTLGFRGEALPSISSVSEVVAISSTGDKGYRVELENGKVEKIEQTSANKGTTIDVKNLFYNTPARLKYLKSDYTELARINEIVSKHALAHTDISFSLYIDEKLNFSSSGRGDVNEVIASLYGLEVAREMKPFSKKDSDFEVSGYTSSIGISKSNRNFITTILNGRPVRVLGVHNAVVDAYKTYLMDGRFPITVVNIEMDPSLIDVNVHPSKNEVRISKELQLLSLIESAISDVFKNNMIAPKVYAQAVNKNQQIKMDVMTFFNEKAKFSDIDQVREAGDEEINSLNFEFIDNSQVEREGYESGIQLIPIGQYAGKYIIAYDDEALYLVDQHAAAERINYEKFLEDFNDQERWTYTDLLVPLIIQVRASQSTQLIEYIPELEKIGIKISPFGINSFRVSSIPTWMKDANVQEYIEEAIEQVLNSQGKIKVGDLRSNAIAMLSCKAALKANRHLSLSEMSMLLRNLLMCNNPFTCPHGRPITILFTMGELDKMFKRT